MNWKWVVVLSLALNVLLALVLQLERRAAPAPARPPPVATSTNAIYRDPGTVWPQELATGEASLKRKGAAPGGSIEAADYPTFIRRLRAAGLSDETILTLVVAEFHQRQQDDYLALQAQFDRGELSQEELTKRTAQASKETKAALEALLGRETYRSYEMSQDFDLARLAQTGKFSDEVLERYFDLKQKHDERRAEMATRLGTGEFESQEFQIESQKMEKLYRAELEKSLGAQVARQILTATDPTVQTLRRQLKETPLTDEEAAEVAQILRDYNDAIQDLSILVARDYASPEEIQPDQQSVEEEKQERLLAVLGPERYAEYERQNDYTFQQMSSWAKRNELTDEQVNYVYGVVKDWREHQRALQSQVVEMPELIEDDAVFQQLQAAEDERLAAWEQANVAARDTLQAYLGPERYEQLRRLTGNLP